MKITIRTLVVMLIIFGLISCNTTKVVNLEELPNFSRQCYEVKQDSFIYTVKKCIENNLACYGIQSYGFQKSSKEQFRNVPNSRKELETNTAYWNKRFDQIQNVTGFYGGIIIGTIDKNTKFNIYNLAYQEWGTWGHFWKIKIKILTGEYKGKIIQVSDLIYLPPPSWLKGSSYEMGPVWKEQYVGKCE